MPASLTVVIGGAASGKSSWAEQHVENAGIPKVYIATAQAHDDEMAAKIAAHKKSRGPGWETREAPLDPGDVLADLPAGRAVLVDCATMWLSNLLLRDADTGEETDRFLQALAACPADVTVVTNEVGQGVVPDNALARRFREAQGRLNVRLAQQADLVVHVVAGLPNVLKGAL